MKKLFGEFKDFIARGNVMDMAIGVIIGGAFMAIVNSLVNDIVNPFIKLISGGGTEVSGLSIPVAGTENGIDFGSFISAIINFLIIAVIVFLLVKAINKFMKDKKESADSPTQVCPHCLAEGKVGATRCPHCTGEIKSTVHTV